MRDEYDYVVLMGPPGSGKTHLADRLAEELGLVHRPLEPDIMSRFGTGEAFARRKIEALRYMEKRLLRMAADSDVPIVFESTGLSDRSILQRLMETHRLLLVRVDAPRDVCASRVTTRERGKNLNNDPEYATRFYDFWVESVAPQYAFDVVVDNRSDGGDPLKDVRERLVANPPEFS